MKNFYTLLLVAFCSLASFAQEENVTTYYLIRHAEKSLFDAGDNDPVLSLDGINRAKKWVSIFENTKFDAIYSTDYKRTKLTAKPIATANKIPTYKFDQTKMYDDAFKFMTKGKTVLVVGHSNTTPQLANMILGAEKYQEIDDAKYGNLYIITVIGDKASGVLLNLE